MGLTPEEKQRIEDEERRRLAEEEYRAHVRAELHERSTGTQLVRSRRPWAFWIPVVLVAVLLALFAARLAVDHHRKSAATREASSVLLSNPNAAAETSPAGTPASSAEPRAMSATEIFEAYSNSVVLLENYNEDNQLAATGSGFCVGDSLIATNYHVIRGAARMVARGKESMTYEGSDIESYDGENDVAILRFDNLHLKALLLGDPTGLKRGDHVTALGAPLGIQNTLSDGMVTNLVAVGQAKIIQTSAPISHGSSGGPLFDDHGRVLGITSATKPEGELINFAIPIVYVQRLLQNPGPVDFPQFLTQTRVATPILEGSIGVAHGTAVPLAFNVPANHVAVIAGNFNIRGGMGNDINWGLIQVQPTGQAVPIIPLGRYSGQAAIRRSLPAGNYALLFDNRFSALSAKTITGSVALTYFR